MAGSFYDNNSDSMDISELASLNDEISDEFIEQLQNKLTNNIPTTFNQTQVNVNDDTTLFEEPISTNNQEDSSFSEKPSENDTNSAENDKKESTISVDFDDNFIKKYKAKLNKKAINMESKESEKPKKIVQPVQEEDNDENSSIENLSQGNITERNLTRELKDYNDSLDFLDGNVKYSKYVIYIDPQNVDFIEGLTVKERKNLINGILRQQDDIAITKKRFKIIQTVLVHIIIAILTISISIPIVYYTINASLEATIDNHRRAQTNWQALYKSHGKITPNQ